ncbi:MAG: glycosyltransferase [Planctomycetaceae bacterium]|nr:glycosyltransferase [Planctomycetaceae bacterium]
MPPKRIKILQIIPTLDRCGAEKQMVLLASNLPKDEFEVEVVALTRTGPYAADLEQANIPLIVIGKKFKLDPFACFRLKNAVRKFKPDIVHSWLFAANAYGRQAAIACGVPHVIAAERCVDPWKGAYHFFIDKYYAKKTDFIATNSEGVKDFYVKHGLPGEKFVVIPNAVEAKWTRDKRTIINHQFPALFSIGIVARLWKQKRIDDLLWVFQTLDFMEIKFQAFIIGDGPERDFLLRLRDNWNLSHCVHFLGARNDVNQLMPQFDVLLNSSAYEGQSNSILEAMALGIPVIATDIPGNTDLVVDGGTGFLVPDGGDFRLRRRMFVAKIIEFMENPGLRQTMGEKSQRRIAEEFTLEKMVERYAALYRRTIVC